MDIKGLDWFEPEKSTIQYEEAYIESIIKKVELAGLIGQEIVEYDFSYNNKYGRYFIKIKVDNDKTTTIFGGDEKTIDDIINDILDKELYSYETQSKMYKQSEKMKEIHPASQPKKLNKRQQQRIIKTINRIGEYIEIVK